MAKVLAPNPWLPVAERLAREVAARDYIHDIDAARRGGGGPLRACWAARAAAVFAMLLVGALIGQAVLWVCGLRLASPAQLRLADAVHRVDPRAERWSDERLQARLEYRREAMDLIEHTVATSVTSTFPYLSALSGHPSPLVNPGAAPALLMLANALDRFPPGQRGHYVQNIVALALALDDPDLQVSLDTFASLSPDLRRRLVADRGARLRHLFAAELALQDTEAERDRLQAQLSAERAALDVEVKALASAVEWAQRRQRELSAADRRCAAAFTPYRACLVNAAREGAIP